jgi:hypothetical protein
MLVLNEVANAMNIRHVVSVISCHDSRLFPSLDDLTIKNKTRTDMY